MSEVFLSDGTEVREYAEPYIVAEVNSSHNGSVDIAKKMIDVACSSGCDCVKFQSWTVNSLYSKTYYDQNPIAKRFVNKLSLSCDELKQLALYCKSKGIAFSSTPYSKEEVDFLVEECKVPFVKISSMEVNNPEYIRYIARKQVAIVISTGMSDYEEVKNAINVIESENNKNIVILHCVSIYPTPLEQANINNILKLREMFPKYPIGYSDHTLGDIAAVTATTLGAAMIEKHITLDSKKIGMDNQMAMEPEDLKKLVKRCKSIKTILGTKERILQPEELKQRVNMRRSLVTTRALKIGDIITTDSLDVKRPGIGIEPSRISEFIGCKVNRDINSDSVIFESDIDKK